MVIKSLDKWREVSHKLATHNFSLYCLQHDWYEPDGFQASFCSTTRREVIHLETKIEEVQKAIMLYNPVRRGRG